MSAEQGYVSEKPIPLSKMGIALDIAEDSLRSQGVLYKVRDDEGCSIFSVAFYHGGRWGVARGAINAGEDYKKVFERMGLNRYKPTIALAEITRKDGNEKGMELSAPCVYTNHVVGSVIGLMDEFEKSKNEATKPLVERTLFYKKLLNFGDKSGLAFVYAVGESYSLDDGGSAFATLLEKIKDEACSFHLVFISPGKIHLIRSKEVPERVGQIPRLFYGVSRGGIFFGSELEAVLSMNPESNPKPVQESSYLEISFR